MKTIMLLLYVVCFTSFISAEDAGETDSLSFHCTVLYPETAEYPEVTVISDTVRFRLFYVDDECSGFTYRFSLQEDVLLLQRITTSPDACTSDEQLLYGVEGFISNVPKGNYLLELQTGASEKNLESIFREAVAVKK